MKYKASRATYKTVEPFSPSLGDLLGISSDVTSSTYLENQVDNYITQNQMNQLQSGCTATQTAKNVMKISGVSGSTLEGIRQENIAKNTCMINAVAKALEDAGASTKLINDVKKSQNAAGLFTDSDETTDIINRSSNTLKQEVINSIINNCITEQDVSNELEITNINDSTLRDIVQVNGAYNECVQSSLADAMTQAGVDTNFQQKQETEQTTKTPIVSDIADAVQAPFTAAAEAGTIGIIVVIGIISLIILSIIAIIVWRKTKK